METYFAIVSLLLASCILASLNAKASTDLLVRYHAPQNTEHEATLSALDSLGQTQATEAEVINSSEGLVKLKFDTEKEADLAFEHLKLSPRVTSVSQNHWYRPAIKYSFHLAEPVALNGDSFLDLPFSKLLLDPTATLPDVSLPPSSVLPGTDPLLAKDWAMSAIHLTDVISQVGSRRVIAAVIDTGIDYNHEDLAGGLWRKDGDPQEVGYDFAHGNNRPYDVVHFDVEGCMANTDCALGFDQSKFLINPGHGTHCAGHVSAVYQNSAGIRGVAAGSPVMGIKFFYDYGEAHQGEGDDAAAIKAIDYALKNGVRVISASWGGKMTRSESETSELKQAVIRAQKAGVLFVVAAGNDGSDQDSSSKPAYPAAFDLDNLITVAATDPKDALAPFSNYGERSVHLAAPGVKILSTTVGNHYGDVVARFKDSDGKEQEVAWDGTSMAAPIVAGGVALVWSHYPDENYHQIRDRILKTVRVVPGLQGKVVTGGILDVAAALKNTP